jgi:nucleoside-diphosphate-sugar epimerase
VLRTARFFLEPDDSPDPARGVGDANVKANEYVHRRVALEDVVDAHLCAAEHAPRIGFDRFVISADTALSPDDVELLHRDAAAVLADRHPDVDAVWREIGWRWPRRLDRVYDNSKARDVLGWQPRFGVSEIAELVRLTGSVLTPMADLVGSKEYLSSGYHRGEFGGRGDRSN